MDRFLKLSAPSFSSTGTNGVAPFYVDKNHISAVSNQTQYTMLMMDTGQTYQVMDKADDIMNMIAGNTSSSSTTATTAGTSQNKTTTNG